MKERTNNSPISLNPLNDERRAAQKRMVALTAALNNIAVEVGINPAEGVFSMIDCGNGEIMLAAIILRINATNEPSHCTNRANTDLNVKFFMMNSFVLMCLSYIKRSPGASGIWGALA